jgi:hypothetical protein
MRTEHGVNGARLGAGRLAVLHDLAALAPPALVCAAFLIAVFAFLRREMRAPKKPADSEHSDDPGIDNPPDQPDDAG